MRKKFLATAMALVCTASLAACGGNPAEKDPTPTSAAKPTEAGNTNENNEPDDADKEKEEDNKSSLPDKLDNANLVIVWDMTEEAWKAAKEEDPDAFNLVWTTKEVFEEKYGGKVEVIGVGWGDQASTVISMVNAGEVCDLAQAHDQNFPIYGAKNIVQDISDRKSVV